MSDRRLIGGTLALLVLLGLLVQSRSMHRRVDDAVPSPGAPAQADAPQGKSLLTSDDAPSPTSRVPALEEDPIRKPGQVVAKSPSEQESPSQKFRLLSPSGEVLPGCSVELRVGERLLCGSSGADGICEFQMNASRDWSLTATYDGRASSGLLESESFPAGVSNPQDVQLYELVRVEGAVLQAEGVPAVGAVVSATYGSTRLQGGTPQAVSTRAGSAGEFRFDLEGTGGMFVLRATWPGMLPCEERVTVVPGQPSRVELMLLPATELTGLVLDPKGAPVVEATVHVVAGQSRQERGGARYERQQAQTDDRGVFRLKEAPSLDALLVATHPDWAASEPVELAAGAVNSSGLLVLHLSSKAVIRGDVTWSDGEPAAGALINVMRDVCHPGSEPAVHLMHHELLYGMSQAIAGHDGSFTIDGLRAGEHGYLLACVPFPEDPVRRDQFEQLHELRAGSTGVHIVLDTARLRGAVLRMRVLKEDSGEPLTRMTVFLYERRDDGTWLSTSRGVESETGEFERQGLAPGTTYAAAVLPVKGYLTALVGPWEASSRPHEETVYLRVPTEVVLRASPAMLNTGARYVEVVPTRGHPYSSDPLKLELKPDGSAAADLGPGDYIAYVPDGAGKRQHSTAFRVEPLAGHVAVSMED